jgi:hypothetical protein
VFLLICKLCLNSCMDTSLGWSFKFADYNLAQFP